MRMRKKKWAEGWMEEHSDYITSTPQDYKGKWKKMLNKDILHVEIGMGKGDYLRQMSKMYPEAAWVGIERDPSAAAVAARKAVEENYDLSNNHMICGNAEFMLDWFEENEIDVIHLNFSDPWPKTRHHKRSYMLIPFCPLSIRPLTEIIASDPFIVNCFHCSSISTFMSNSAKMVCFFLLCPAN